MKTRQVTVKPESKPSNDSEQSKQIKEKEVSSIEDLKQRIDRFEKVLAKMAHFSGNNRILIEYDLKPWIPGTKDMKKFKS